MMKNDYTFRLHENPKFGWNPRLSAKDYIAILANITAIRIRGTYGGEGQGLLDEVKLGTAERGGTGPPATWEDMSSHIMFGPESCCSSVDLVKLGMQ